MASDVPHHHHPLRIPLSTVESGTVEFHNGRPVILNIDAADAETTTAPTHEGNPAAALASPTPAPTMLPSVRSLLMSCEGSLPFVFIILAKLLYDHRLGILVFAAMFGTLFHANSTLRRLIAQHETENSMESVRSLLWLIVFVAANEFFIYYVFDEQKLYRSLYLVCPEVEHMTLWVLLWVTVTTDFVLKFATVIIKALIALLPRQILPLKKKGKWYMLVEVLSQSYRCVVPITPWIYFLLDDENSGRLSFATLLLVAYVAFKGNHLIGVAKQLRLAVSKFSNELTYGCSPSRTQLDSYDNSCPICQDKFTNPVSLSCTHIFCEDCVSTWFNRERTCPMCRANIVDTPHWRDGATNTNFQIY